jgi:hypothetical protein
MSFQNNHVHRIKFIRLDRPLSPCLDFELLLGAKYRLYNSLRLSVRPPFVGWLVRPSVSPHNEILRNLLTSKTSYVEIATRLVWY